MSGALVIGAALVLFSVNQGLEIVAKATADEPRSAATNILSRLLESRQDVVVHITFQEPGAALDFDVAQRSAIAAVEHATRVLPEVFVSMPAIEGRGGYTVSTFIP